MTIRINKEIPAHVANRLQAALWREAVHLVAEGVYSVEDVDKAVTAGPGLRWSVMGPHMLFSLGSGGLGIDGFCQRYRDSFHEWWRSLGAPELTGDIAAILAKGIGEEERGRSFEALAAERDAKPEGDRIRERPLTDYPRSIPKHCALSGRKVWPGRKVRLSSVLDDGVGATGVSLRLRLTGPCRIAFAAKNTGKRHAPPDARWYGAEPEVLAEIRGALAERLIPRIERAVGLPAGGACNCPCMASPGSSSPRWMGSRSIFSVSAPGDSAVDVNMRCWVKASDYWAFLFDARQKAKQAFDDVGISIPFPQREVRVIETQGK